VDGGSLVKIFLSHSFDPADRPLAEIVSALLESFEIRPITGEVLGGGALTPEVMGGIDGCDGLVALLTPRQAKPDGLFSTSQWVRVELNYARARRMRAIAVVDVQVDLEAGAYQENERVNYDSASPSAAFLKLARVIGLWKREAGRLLKVRILPDTLARRLGGSRLRCGKGRGSRSRGFSNSWATS